MQDGLYRLSAAWRLRDARIYFPLPTVQAFGWIAPPTMPSADFCAAVRSPYGDLSPVAGTQRRPPEVRPTAFAARPSDLPPRSLMTMDFAISGSLVRPGRPRYPLLVHRAAALLHAFFRPHLAMTPLRFTNPSPSSGWIEDFHLQAVVHTRHTTKNRPACAGRLICFQTAQAARDQHQSASGLGRSWKCTSFGRLPLPPSTWNGVRLPAVVHRPRPFQPPFGSSMRPSTPLA